MSRLASVIIRGLISLFHLSVGVTSSVYVIYTLVKWGSLEGCLPPMVQLYGGTFTMKNQLPDLCDCIFTTLIAAAFINMAMCGFINCMWKYRNSGFLLINLVLCLAMAGFNVFVASMMTTYKMIWCDTIIQRLAKDVTPTCNEAANEYGRMVESRNITHYYERIEVQMLGLWALVPLTVLVIFLYGIAMTIQRVSSSPPTGSSTSSPPTPPSSPQRREVTPLPSPTPPTTPPVHSTTPNYGTYDTYDAPNPFDAATPEESTPLLLNHDGPPTEDSSDGYK